MNETMARAVAEFLYNTGWLKCKDRLDVSCITINMVGGTSPISCGTLNFEKLYHTLCREYPEWTSWDPRYQKHLKKDRKIIVKRRRIVEEEISLEEVAKLVRWVDVVRGTVYVYMVTEGDYSILWYFSLPSELYDATEEEILEYAKKNIPDNVTFIDLI